MDNIDADTRSHSTVRPHKAGLTRFLTSLALVVTAASSLDAQAPAPADGRRPWIIGVSHYAKWPTLAGSAALTAVAILRNNDADQVFTSLLGYCRNAGTGCRVTEEGNYADPNAEALFRETVRLDRQARAWLVAGQLTLAAAGGMFLIDLVSGDSRPKNIPYTGAKFLAEPGRVGVRWEF